MGEFPQGPGATRKEATLSEYNKLCTNCQACNWWLKLGQVFEENPTHPYISPQELFRNALF